MAQTLTDRYGRKFQYLRLSIIDACNFRCAYCLPDGYKKTCGFGSELTREEIRNLGVAFTAMGTRKIRLTGGEPTLRKDFLEIAADLKGLPGIERLALSTNGFRLRALATDLKESFDAINVSVDSLDPEIFRKLTGSDQLPEILNGIEAALDEGLSVKINAVLMRDQTEREIPAFQEWVRTRPVAVRFIELMPTGTNQDFFARHHVRAETIVQQLTEGGWRECSRGAFDGPAREFWHPDFAGRIGVIAPYAKDFCASCNRLRVTSQGDLRLCLFGEGGFSLRPWLRSRGQTDELIESVLALLQKKDVSHFLNEGLFGNNHTFSAMGG